jgi:hypothetical protein
LTLGAVLMLGGVTGGRGDELLGSVAADGSSSWGGFVLPTLPENWSDMPFRLTASETVSYNSNIFALPSGTSVPGGGPQSDFTSTSSYGLSTRANWSGQQFFFDGSFGVIRYLHRSDFDSNIYSFNPGVNWIITSRCAGTLGAVLTKSPATISELVGVGINYSTLTALNETGKCAVSNGYSLLFNSGLTELTNSNALDAVNNSRTIMLAAGIEYAKGPSDLSALATISDTDYTNRGVAETALGLADTVVFHRFDLTYVRTINPNLSVTGQLGLVGVTNAFGLGLPKTLLPTYSLAVTWAITPKLSLTANGSRTVAPPTTLIGNAEVAYSSLVSLTYQATPKIALTAYTSVVHTSSAFTPGVAGTIDEASFVATNFYSVNAQVTYAMTPFLSAALSAAYTERAGDHLITPQNLITVSLNYKPF